MEITDARTRRLKLDVNDSERHPNAEPLSGRPLTPWRIGFVICTLLALFWAAQLYVYNVYFGSAHMPWLHALGWGLFDWYLWGAFAILVAKLARRFPLGRRLGGKTLGLHILCAAVISCAYFMLTATTWLAFRPDDGTETTWLREFELGVLRWLPWNLMTYGAILGVVHAFEYHRVSRDREIRASQLETQLAQAQLQALKMQLHPHFLFNTLHAISTLIHKDANAADQMVARLSELLRHVLDGGAGQKVPLRDELSFLRKYLDIERVRFGDRLDVRFAVEPDTLDAAVPSLILQPLVENAVRHAVAPYAVPCKIEIAARRNDGKLTLDVVDSGPGLRSESAVPVREGVGLTNTRARLRQLYDDDQRLELRNATTGGLVAHIEIPFSPAVDGSGWDASE